ncbi:hypothetical protein HRI_002732500 [Hibiscus trionum]|uniref:Uncharacterized protein n=1 Tax=Hibiscus trionum TaxID=183268 RepID=A0A9W7M5G5_HIBTR|nr:hypothetical protein HRI_002732500 [Hibiscus trionum]
MEESEKIYGKKRLPSIPSNYVTLLQLQERWIQEKEGKQKGKEDGEEHQQQEGKETIVDDEVSGRGSREDGRFPRFKRDNGKRVAVGKPSDEKITVAEDFDTEVKGDELKKKKKKKKKKNWGNKTKNEIEEKARAANKGEEVKERAGNALLPASTENNEEEGELIGDEVHAPKLSSAEEVNVKARREWKPSIIPRTHGRRAEIGQKFQEMSLDGEIRTAVHAPESESIEARRESQPSIIPRPHGRMAERKFQAKSMGREIRTGASVVEENVEARRESQPNIIPKPHGRTAERKFQAKSMGREIRTGVHAPEPASVVEENVEARRESQPNIIPKPRGRTAERKYQVNGEIRTRHYRRYGRQTVDFNHRGGNPELNRTYGRRRELNQRSEGMVWVKKGEVKDQNGSGIQSSSCSSKELC